MLWTGILKRQALYEYDTERVKLDQRLSGKKHLRIIFSQFLYVFCALDSPFFLTLVHKHENYRWNQAYLPGGGLPVVNMTGDPRGSRLLHWARPWSAVIPGEYSSGGISTA